MNTTQDYVLLAILLPLLLWFLTKPSGPPNTSWNPGRGITVASWLVFFALLYWFGRQMIWPMFF